MLDEQGVERQVAQKEFAPPVICRGRFSTLFHLLITRVTRKGTNHESSNLLARNIPKLVSQPRSEDTLSGIWDKEGRGCRRNSIT